MNRLLLSAWLLFGSFTGYGQAIFIAVNGDTVNISHADQKLTGPVTWYGTDDGVPAGALLLGRIIPYAPTWNEALRIAREMAACAGGNGIIEILPKPKPALKEYEDLGFYMPGRHRVRSTSYEPTQFALYLVKDAGTR